MHCKNKVNHSWNIVICILGINIFLDLVSWKKAISHFMVLLTLLPKQYRTVPIWKMTLYCSKSRLNTWEASKPPPPLGYDPITLPHLWPPCYFPHYSTNARNTERASLALSFDPNPKQRTGLLSSKNNTRKTFPDISLILWLLCPQVTLIIWGRFKAPRVQ